MSGRRADRVLERACDRVEGELRHWDDADFVRHPARSAVEKFSAAVHRLGVHAGNAMEDLLRPRDDDPIEDSRAMDADRHEGAFRPDEISEEERRRRPEASRLPPGLFGAVIELHRAIQEKWKEMGRKRRHWKTRCYVNCLSDAELTSEGLLEGEPTEPAGARAALVH